MEYKSITEINGHREIAVVINVSTKYLSTLALLSIKRHTRLPVLVINCPLKNDDGSYDYFVKLMKDIDFDLLCLPLKSHGSTLDYIFKNINCERILFRFNLVCDTSTLVATPCSSRKFTTLSNSWYRLMFCVSSSILFCAMII